MNEDKPKTTIQQTRKDEEHGPYRKPRCSRTRWRYIHFSTDNGYFLLLRRFFLYSIIAYRLLPNLTFNNTRNKNCMPFKGTRMHLQYFGGVRVAHRFSLFFFLWWFLFCLKTIDLPQVTDKLYHIMLYQDISPWAGFELKALVVIATSIINIIGKIWTMFLSDYRFCYQISLLIIWCGKRWLVFNATFDNISIKPRWSALSEYLVKTTDPKVTDKLDQIMLYRVHIPRTGFELTT